MQELEYGKRGHRPSLEITFQPASTQDDRTIIIPGEVNRSSISVDAYDSGDVLGTEEFYVELSTNKPETIREGNARWHRSHDAAIVGCKQFPVICPIYGVRIVYVTDPFTDIIDFSITSSEDVF